DWHPPRLDELSDSWAALALQERRRRGCDDTRVLLATHDHACDFHGLFCAHSCTLRGLRQFLPANPCWRRGYALPAFQYDVVLGHVRGVLCHDFVVLRGRRANP